ncbi:MAG: SurA N-terminal domain-containing protein [Thermodesulfovibrio sp.]
MIKTLRKNAKYFYFLFFIVIITFIFWGVGTVDNQPTNTVAEVGGQKITAERFWRQYDETLRVYREVFGQKSEDLEKKLKEKVLEDLINEEVLLYLAKKYKIEATNEEIQDAIINDPKFKRNGVFQKEIYFQTLKLNKITPTQYEAFLRRQITISKTLQTIMLAKDRSEISDEAFLKSFLMSVRKNIPIKINKEVLS